MILILFDKRETKINGNGQKIINKSSTQSGIIGASHTKINNAAKIPVKTIAIAASMPGTPKIQSVMSVSIGVNSEPFDVLAWA